MYSDKKTNQMPKLLAVAALLILLLGFGLQYRREQKSLDEETIQAIRDTVQRTALQCYVVEGVYPTSLAYLEENYGLRINTDRYYVKYEVYASNLPPTVRVIRRGKTE